MQPLPVMMAVITACFVHAEGGFPYAFSVQHGGATTSGSSHTKIPFSVIRRNDANSYSVSGKEFTAPVKGVYLFHYAAYSAGGAIVVYLHSSAKGFLSSAGAGTASTIASNQIIVKLDAGEKISVQLHPGYRSRSCNPPCSSFSGFLLYPLQP